MAGSTEWRVAWGKSTVAWGVVQTFAAAAGGSHLVKIASESMPSGVPEPIKDDNVGDVLSGATYQGNFNLEGNAVVPVRFDGIERFLALLMGDDIATEIDVGASYKHQMIFQSNNTGIFGTMVIDKGLPVAAGNLYEYESCKVTQLELGHDGGRLIATLGVIANKMVRTGQTNTHAILDGLAFLSTGTLGLFTQLTVLMTEVTGAEADLVAPTHELLVSEARLTLNRNISGDHVTGTSAGEVDEPETDGMPEGQLVLSFPTYKAASDAFVKAGQDLQTGRVPKVYKASLVWTGAVIGATATNYELAVEMPALTLADGPANAGGPGAKVPLEMTLNVLTPQTAPFTDMVWVTGTPLPPLMIHVINALATDAITLIDV